MNMNNKRAAMKTQQCRNVCINSIFKLKYGKRIVICTLKFLKKRKAKNALHSVKIATTKQRWHQNRASTAAITGGDDGYGYRRRAAAATVKSNAFIVGTMGILFFSAFFLLGDLGTWCRESSDEHILWRVNQDDDSHQKSYISIQNIKSRTRNFAPVFLVYLYFCFCFIYLFSFWFRFYLCVHVVFSYHLLQM